MEISRHLWEAAPRLLLVLVTLFLVVNMVNPAAKADRGGFRVWGDYVAEGQQKAIVAWNGTDEVLVPSTARARPDCRWAFTGNLLSNRSTETRTGYARREE
jgi:hypothetical protein